MTLLHIDGFDHYGDDETKMTEGVYDQVDAAFTLSSTNPRTGNKCLRRDSSSVESIVLKNLNDQKDTLACGIAFNMDQLPNSFGLYKILEFRDQGNNTQFQVYGNVTGSVFVRLGANLSTIASSRSGILEAGKYSHIEIAAKSDSELLEESALFCGDINSMNYTGNNKVVSSEMATPFYMQINSTGTKIIVLNSSALASSCILYEYDLSIAFDVSTATYSGNSFTLLQSGSMHSFKITDSESRLYATSSLFNTVYQYNITGFDLTTVSYTGNSFQFESFDPIFNDIIFDVDFNSSGSKAFVVNAKDNLIQEYNLLTSWDISTASDTGRSFDISTTASDPHSFSISPDGNKAYVLDVFDNIIYQYDMSIQFNIMSASYNGISYSVTAEAEDTHGFCFSGNGNDIYVVSNASDALYQYSMECYATQSNGIIEIRVNGVTEIILSNAKTTFTESKEYSYIALTFGSDRDHGVTTDIDDFYIWDDLGSWNNTFLGDRRCYLLKPNQDTNISDFDPSSGSFGYKMIDDDSPDDDSSYIIAEAYLQSGSPLTGTSEFEIENLQDGSSLISGINVIARASKTDNTSAEIYTTVNSGADTLTGNAHILTTSYRYYNDIYEYDPSIVSSFTKDSVNSVSVSITADDLDPTPPLESPDIEGSPTDNDGGIPQDYILFYTFDNISGTTIFDETGTYNGTLIGSPVTTTGVVGDALVFDGVNDQISAGTIPVSDDLQLLGDFCFSFWINRNEGTDPAQRIVSKERSTAGGGQGGYEININNDSGATWRLRFGVAGTEHIMNPSDNLTSNTTHVILDCSSNTLSCYFDNVFVGSATIGSRQNEATVFRMGQWSFTSAGNRRYKGWVDQFRVYNRSLSSDERTSLFNEA